MSADPLQFTLAGIVEKMIAQSGEMWLSADMDRSVDHNAVVIGLSPETCARLLFCDGKWSVTRITLTMGELAGFFAAFGSHWSLLIGSLIPLSGGRHVRVRAFILNGNKARRWSISIDPVEVEISA